MKWFKRNNKNSSSKREPKWVDLDGQVLQEGDEVEVLRYEMGRSVVVKDEDGLAYQSIESGKIISCWYMVDAATTHQKVRKLS